MAVVALRAQEGPQSSSTEAPAAQEDAAAKKKDKKKAKGAGDKTHHTFSRVVCWNYSLSS